MIARNKISDPREIIIQGSRTLGIPLEDRAVEKMLRHMEFLRIWQPKVNLTALRLPREIAVLHFLDSLTVLKVIPTAAGLKILDIGTGAGFPGIVLAVVRDSLRLALLDRNPKKIVFLKRLVHELGLEDITYINRDLKEVLENPGSIRFDIAVSRAFSSDPATMDSIHSLLTPGGSLVIMGGPSFDLRNFPLDHFRLSDLWEGSLPLSDSLRRVSLYSKR